MVFPPILPVSLWLLAAAPGQPGQAGQPAVAPNAPPETAVPFDPNVIAPPPGQPPPQDRSPGGQARALAVQLGHTIGTAMECAVGQDMNADEAKAEKLIDQAANDAHEDSMALEDRFHDAMAEGRDQVLDEQANCAQAKSDLDKFEGQEPY